MKKHKFYYSDSKGTMTRVDKHYPLLYTTILNNAELINAFERNSKRELYLPDDEFQLLANLVKAPKCNSIHIHWSTRQQLVVFKRYIGSLPNNQKHEETVTEKNQPITDESRKDEQSNTDNETDDTIRSGYVHVDTDTGSLELQLSEGNQSEEQSDNTSAQDSQSED